MKDTSEIILWFKNIENKQKTKNFCICHQRFLSWNWMKKDGLFNVTIGAL